LAERSQQQAAARPVAPEDLFRLRFLMGADLAPAGNAVVYALSRTDFDANADYIDLYLLDLESGATRQLTEGDGYYGSAAFSPDGRSIAFLSSQGGPPQIYVLPVDGGEAREVTSIERGVGGGPVWSPDGTRIAFTAGPSGPPRDPSRPYRVTRAMWRADGVGLIDDALQDVYVVDAAGGEPVRLTGDLSMNFSPVWAADGESIVYMASHDPDSLVAMRLRRVDLDGTITDLVEGGGFLAGHTACPDGRIAYLTGFYGSESNPAMGSKGDVWVLDPDTGARERRSASLDVGVGGILQSDMLAVVLSLGSLVVSDDAVSAYAAVYRSGEGAIFRFALSGAEAFKPVVEGERACAPVSLRGDKLLFAAFGIDEPGDLYLLDVSTGTERRLTELNAGLMAELEIPPVHRLAFTSEDGAAVEGWFLPSVTGEAPYPTVLGIHGGPHNCWGYTFNFDFLMFSAAGFGVLFVNPRGSTGYGDEFATQAHSDAALDYADLMAGVDHAILLGLADPDRLGVFGISGGAALTGWIIGHTDRFKAACPESPAFNWLTSYSTSDSGLWAGPAMLGGKPHECHDVYERRSAITYAHRCTTPTLFLQHDEDLRTPPEQTEQFYAVLKAEGITAEMLRFPGTGHTGSITGPPSHRHAQNEALLEWMTRYVLASGSDK
jgi:dipeptidyl aminopeptidase/acylaminoacyl peptidase